jgi:hypothetical protein
MIPMFLGLTMANLLLLGTVFVLGLGASHSGGATDLYLYHVTWAIAAGLLTALVHSVVYTYFMGTSRWLAAAADKADLESQPFIQEPLDRKRTALFVMLTPIGMTMLTMMGGAATDTLLWWPGGVHLVLGIATLVVNIGAAIWEFRLIRAQGQSMDDALAVLNRKPEL